MAKCPLHNNIDRDIEILKEKMNKMNDEVIKTKTEFNDTSKLLKWIGGIIAVIIGACGVSVVMLFADIATKLNHLPK